MGFVLLNTPVEGEPSIEGEFSLGQCNLDTSSSSSNATSRIAHDAIVLHDSNVLLDSSLEIELRPKSRRAGCGRKHISVNNMISLEPPPEVDYLINDSNIHNRNWAILKHYEEVVNECNDLGMTYVEPQDQLCAMAKSILWID